MNYRETVAHLESLRLHSKNHNSISPDPLILQALSRLEIQPPANRVIVIAGTNGKGSTAACLQALLLDAGKHVGLFTSPHLIEATERIRIDQNDLSQENFVRLFEIVQSKTQDLSLNYFQILTLMACVAFFTKEITTPVDYAIFEVGMGGLYDATQAIPHSVSVITSLSIDHEAYLGKTLESIARNKFGIITHRNRVFYTPLAEELLALQMKIERETESTWSDTIAHSFKVEKGLEGPRFLLETKWGKTELSLPGARGAQNAALALSVSAGLGFDPRKHLPILSRVRWPGRMERFKDAKSRAPIFLSGDHNPDGIRSLLELLPHYPRKTLRVLLGLSRSKNRDATLRRLYDLPNTEITLTESPVEGLKLEEFGPWVARSHEAVADPNLALDQILARAGPKDLVLVTGSLFLVGAIRKRLLALTPTEKKRN